MKLNSLTLAKRYSRALFELASDNNELELVTNDLNAIHEIFVSNPAYVQDLASPSLPSSAKQAIINTLKQDAHPLVANFIQMIFEYQHLDAVVLIIEYFNRLVNDKNKIVHANATTAVELSTDQKDQLAARLAQHLGANKVVLDTTIDPDIIAGVIVRADGKIIDGSLATKIAKIRQMLVK
ncbi:ATP synthase F1 subunit delta [Periweissella ghanensis]|uniref:ATP synthase subunit delta n=1 Tax=Periweissella ghanensis TaxID=467997 RepID=A0ABN8BPV8_9LACO|nr:ATP synthase F1 subunit delta [Periweissella ghanensis]MCM0601573.1 F0F1 ATP synthase subunit delta [Periweissella ghanensis]CAH0418650.1 ATP synthase subunit delta [Periweissella ghanensis]